MKKIICCIILLFIIIFSTSCGTLDEARHTMYGRLTAPNDLMRNATAVDSTFSLYVFNGETLTHRSTWAAMGTDMQRLINNFRNVPAARVTDWTPSDITLPIFSFEMTTECRWGMAVAWSNGFWITQEGYVYRFDFDFLTFITQHRWWTRYTSYSAFSLPNAGFLARDEKGWNRMFLTPSPEWIFSDYLVIPEGVEMTLVSNTNESVTYRIENNSDGNFYYGSGWWVEVLLDGAWYGIPRMPEARNMGFAAVLLRMEAGQSRTRTTNLGLYGELPPGTYRLIKYDLYVIFEIE